MNEAADLRDVMQRDDTMARQQLRALCRRSFYFFTKVAIGYNHSRMNANLLDADTFKPRQDWIQYIFVEKKRGLLSDPRAHVKSWGSTVPGPGWLAIQRPNVDHDHPQEFDRATAFVAAHPHLRGVDSRLVIYSDSVQRATKWVGSSKVTWNIDFIRWLFPELVWPNPNVRAYGSWSNKEYHLPGRNNPELSDGFLRGAGLDSKEQGGRADGIFVEDLVGEQSYKSATELERRRDAVPDLVSNLLENSDYKSPNGGFILVIENDWAPNDVNAKIHEQLPMYDVWRRRAYRCYVHGVASCGRYAHLRVDDPRATECAPTDVPLWLAAYPNKEALERVEREKGSAVFARQWLNEPSFDAELDERKVRDFHIELTTYRRGDNSEGRGWCIVIPQLDARPTEIIPLDSLRSHLISIDPATSADPNSARTACEWVAYDPFTCRRYLIDCRADTWGPADAVEAALELYVYASARCTSNFKILVEKVGAQDYFAYGLQTRATARQLRLPLIDLIPVPRNERKLDRIRRRVGEMLGQGLLYVRTGLPLVRHEIRTFPAGKVDTLDALAQAEGQFQLQPARTKKHDSRTAARIRARETRRMRSGMTGIPL